jgi:hypothetical protein
MYFASIEREPSMPVTLTIKQVPNAVAARLKARARASRRSLQGELLSIIEAAAEQGGNMLVREPAAPAYGPGPAKPKEEGMKLSVSVDDTLLERARKAAGNRDEAATLDEGLRALVQREAARRLIRLGGSAPAARLPPRRRSAPDRSLRRGDK